MPLLNESSSDEVNEEQEMQRPARFLFEVLNDTPRELLQEISPRSQTLKYFIKVPMVLIIWTAALMSGLTILFLKLTTEIPHGKDYFDHFALVGVLVLCTIIAAIAQMHMLNVAMKYYD